MRIGVYGGAFNPPHIGHVNAAKAAMNQLKLDKLIVIPSGVSPHKPMPECTPPGDMRLYMTQTAFSKVDNAVVSNVEITKPGASYTINTLTEIRGQYPGAEIFLLAGTDMYLTFESWHRFEDIFKIATPAVFARNADNHEKIAEYSISIQKRYGVHTETVENTVIPISSSMLRTMLPRREGIEYLDDTNYSYIIKNRLYNAKSDWNWLRTQAHAMLKPSRIPHVIGCEEEAVRLARHWGLDEDDAREAAILHDITKHMSAEENFAILKKYGLPAVYIKKTEEKLLHAVTGAAIARGEFGSSDAVADAIRWHTTGRANMSELEKIIYIADYIEPMRDFDEVDVMRTLAYKNINAAMKMGLEISVEDMKQRGIIIDGTTYDALNYFVSLKNRREKI